LSINLAWEPVAFPQVIQNCLLIQFICRFHSFINQETNYFIQWKSSLRGPAKHNSSIQLSKENYQTGKIHIIRYACELCVRHCHRLFRTCIIPWFKKWMVNQKGMNEIEKGSLFYYFIKYLYTRNGTHKMYCAGNINQCKNAHFIIHNHKNRERPQSKQGGSSAVKRMTRPTPQILLFLLLCFFLLCKSSHWPSWISWGYCRKCFLKRWYSVNSLSRRSPPVRINWLNERTNKRRRRQLRLNPIWLFFIQKLIQYLCLLLRIISFTNKVIYQ
jgi:hypothetical protein